MECYFSRLQMLFNNIDTDVLPSVSHDRSTDGQAVCGWRLFKRTFILRKEQSKSVKKKSSGQFSLDRPLSQQHQLGVRTYVQLLKSVIMI